MMHFLERSGDMANMIGLCMGDQGVISRVLAIRAGSVFTFAAATQGEETAPGQIAARTLTDTYRIAQIDTATRVYGVVGNPDQAFSLSVDDEHRIPPRNRQRGLPGIANQQTD